MHRPTPLQEACLQAALLPSEPARNAWHRVRPALEQGDLDGACRSLLPLVYRNLCRAGVDTGLDALKDRYVLTWSENQRGLQSVAALLRAFEQAGIDAIALKGLALVARFYRDAGVRPMADVDVLVRRTDVERAGAVAATLAWEARYRLTPAFLRVKHAAPFDHPLGLACDVHWRVFEEAGATAADEAFRAAAERVMFEGVSLHVPCPADQLLHVCGHAARWDPVPPIRWIADAVVILREASIDWSRLLDQARQRRFALRMRQMLRYLRREWAAAVPPAVESELARMPVSFLERLEYRIRGREHRLLGELPVYVFNCLRSEPRPLRGLPSYLRDAWALESLGEVPRRALTLASRRIRSAISRR